MTAYLPLIIYIFSLGLVLLSLFKDTRYGIFYFFPILPLTVIFIKLKDLPLGKDIIDIMLIAVVLGGLFRKKEQLKTDIRFPLYLFIFWTFFELIMGYNYLGGFNMEDGRLQMWKNYMILPVLFFIVAQNITNFKDIKKLVFLMSLIYLLIAMKFTVDFDDLGIFNWAYKQNSGVFAYLSTNYMAAFMVEYAIVFLCLAYYFRENKKITIYYFGTVLFGIYNILFLFSRGAYLAFICVLMILGILKDRKILMVLAVLVVFWHILLPSSVFQRINMSINAEDGVGGTSRGRGEMWAHAVEQFNDNPIIGVGYRVFGYTLSYEQKSEFKHNTGRAITDTHSLFLNVLAEMGIVGFSIMVYLFYLAARSGWRLFRLARDGFQKGLGLGFFLCVIACIIVNIFGDHWMPISVQAYYWILWALVERGIALVRQTNQADLSYDKAIV